MGNVRCVLVLLKKFYVYKINKLLRAKPKFVAFLTSTHPHTTTSQLCWFPIPSFVPQASGFLLMKIQHYS